LSGVDLSAPADDFGIAIPHGVLRRFGALIGREIALERERWPLWLPAFLGAGIATYFALTVEPACWIGWTALALSAVTALVGRKEPAILFISLPIVAFALGFSAAEWRTDWLAAPRLERKLGPIPLTGRVVEVEELAKGQRVTLDRLSIDRLDPARTPLKVRVHLRPGGPAIKPGDRVTIKAMLLPPSPPITPGAFDFQRHAYFMQLGAVGYSYGRAVVAPSELTGFSLWLAALRDRIAARVTAGLEGAEGGIAAALMTGERGAIPPDVVEAMRDSGLAHLLAIAGLHLGLVTGALLFGVRAFLALVPWIALRYPIKKWAAFAALLGALFYLLITGATVPTERAFIMTSVVLVGVMLDRVTISMRLVAWAAVAVMLIQPESIAGPSFQLSFAAVGALIAAYETLRPRLLGWGQGSGWWRLPLRYLAGVAFTSLITSFATIPFSLYHFDRLAAFGVVTNLIAVPITALWIMPWAIVAFALMPFGLEGLALQPMGWGLKAVIWSAQSVVSWPGSTAILPAMPAWGIALASAGLLWLCLWRRPWRWAGAIGLAVGISSIAIARQPDVIVSADARIFAVRAADGRTMVSPIRGDSFEVDTILKRAGQTDREAWPSAGESSDGRLRCGDFDCLYRAGGQVVALVRKPEALDEDCRVASIVVSAVPVKRKCRSASVVIDRFSLWREGGHAIWLEGGAVRIETVREWRGDRPWTEKRKPRTGYAAATSPREP
jgi:competence protein ComEC